MTRALAAALTLLAAGCSNQPATVIDGSSPAAFASTVSMARGDLGNADRLIFDRAIHGVGGRRFGERDTQALARTTFDGMTAAEVVADQRARDR